VRRCLVHAMYLSVFVVAMSTWGAISSVRLYLYPVNSDAIIMQFMPYSLAKNIATLSYSWHYQKYQNVTYHLRHPVLLICNSRRIGCDDSANYPITIPIRLDANNIRVLSPDYIQLQVNKRLRHSEMDNGTCGAFNYYNY